MHIYIYIIHTHSTQTCVYDFTHRGRFLCQPCKHQRYEVQTEGLVTLHWEEQKSRQLLSMSGLCYYSVDCDSALPCCSADQWVSSGQTNSTNVVSLGSLIVYVAFTVWLNRWMNAVRQSCWVNQHGPVDVFSLEFEWGIYFPKGCEGSNLPTDGPTYQILSA